VPVEIIQRHKQPYRAPDAISFTGGSAPEWVEELTSDRSVADAGLFDPQAVARLWRKCRAASAVDGLSNADNMGLVGVLSTGLVHEQFVRAAPRRQPVTRLETLVDDAMPSHTASTAATGGNS
jgi:asparagine synthase (glutamine-hydrolysing)